MKEYKYTINGNEYKVTIGEIEGNIANVEVNGTAYKVEMPETVEAPKKEKRGFLDVIWRKAKKVTENAKEKTGSWLDEISEEEV